MYNGRPLKSIVMHVSTAGTSTTDSIYMNIYTHTHTDIHAYIHTCMHAYIHAYIPTCIHTRMHTYMHTCHYFIFAEILTFTDLTELPATCCIYSGLPLENIDIHVSTDGSSPQTAPVWYKFSKFSNIIFLWRFWAQLLTFVSNCFCQCYRFVEVGW